MNTLYKHNNRRTRNNDIFNEKFIHKVPRNEVKIIEITPGGIIFRTTSLTLH